MNFEIKNKIQNLRQQIEHHNYKYFVENDPVISDYEYDCLFKELSQLEKDYPEEALEGLNNSPTKNVGSDLIDNTFEEVTHDVPLLSLSKSMNKDELKDFILDMASKGVEEVIVEQKMDGLTCDLMYKENQLKRGATRGNGYIGEDVTQSVYQIQSIPKKLVCLL